MATSRTAGPGTRGSEHSESDEAFGKQLLVPGPDEQGGVEITVTERSDSPTVAEKLESARSGLLLNWPFQLYLESEVAVQTSEALEQPLQTFAWN